MSCSFHFFPHVCFSCMYFSAFGLFSSRYSPVFQASSGETELQLSNRHVILFYSSSVILASHTVNQLKNTPCHIFTFHLSNNANQSIWRSRPKRIHSFLSFVVMTITNVLHYKWHYVDRSNNLPSRAQSNSGLFPLNHLIRGIVTEVKGSTLNIIFMSGTNQTCLVIRFWQFLWAGLQGRKRANRASGCALSLPIILSQGTRSVTAERMEGEVIALSTAIR